MTDLDLEGCGRGAAVNGQADRLVTFNRRDFRIAGERLGIVICSPGDTVKALEGRT